jgi:hypothetical protein
LFNPKSAIENLAGKTYDHKNLDNGESGLLCHHNRPREHKTYKSHADIFCPIPVLSASADSLRRIIKLFLLSYACHNSRSNVFAGLRNSVTTVTEKRTSGNIIPSSGVKSAERFYYRCRRCWYVSGISP